MTRLYFYNPGEIDIRGATIAGLSAKEDESAIGMFGTGLKYSIACILRWGGSVTIWSGTNKYEFHLDDLEFRGKDFQQIIMTHNGVSQSLNITTNYGRNWGEWQVFRELYANALDEGGDVTKKETKPKSGLTVIMTDLGPLFDVYLSRDNIILPKTTSWDVEDQTIQIKNKPSNYLYYKGVRVHKSEYALTYNGLDSTSFQLTEDRSLDSTYWPYRDIVKSIMQCSDRAVIKTALTADIPYAEKGFFWAADYDASDTFIAAACEVYKSDPKRYETLKSFVSKHKPELTIPEVVPMTKVQTMQLQKATKLVGMMGLNPGNYDISVRDLGPSVLGRYDRVMDKIYLSPTLFEQGTKQVLSCLLEELTHAETGLADCTYPMQTHLFNQIVSLYEEHVFGEPV